MAIDSHKLTPVLIGIHLVALPMYARLPPYVLLLIVSFTAWTLLIIAERARQPAVFIRVLLAGVVVGSLLVSYGTIFGQAPGAAMLLMLSFLKLFEMKGKRDVLLVIFLGFFLIATNFFHTQSPWIALYVFVVVVYLTSLLIVFSDRLSSVNFKTRLKISLRMLMQAIPLMLVLFVLFPRLSGPLWGVPEDVQSASTGVGDEMSPGTINSLISSGAVAFRVQFKDEAPAQKDLYWRGLVLSRYDGKTWYRDDWPFDGRYADIHTSTKTRLIDYEVTLEPHGRKWLYALESILTAEGAYIISRERQVLTKEKIDGAITYSVTSGLGALNKNIYSEDREKNTLLPQGANRRTIKLANQLRAEVNTDTEYIKAVLSYFRGQNFIYTLSPPLLGENAMDDFIFSSRQGFCEHYSSAFVYLMRAAGIPARVIVGYQGGAINPLDDYMIVRQSDAHAWTEVWLDDQGWVRIDPTSAVSPGRINQGVTNAGLEEGRLPSVLMYRNDLLLKISFTIDSFNHSWNKWIIGFNDKKQEELLELLGVEDIDKATLFSWMVLAMTLFGVLVALWVFKYSEKKSRDDVAAYYYDVFCKKFEKAGLVKGPSESANEFLLRITMFFPELAQKAGFITRCYQRIRYSSDFDDDQKKQFISAVKQLRIK